MKNSHHKVCGEYVKFLMEKKCGAVSTTFRHLFDLGEGKQGDDICLLTHEYATLLLKEESSKDINDILSVERIEKRVRERIEEKLNS